MNETIADNQSVVLKEKIKDFFFTHMQNQGDHCPVRDILASNMDKWSLFVLYNLSYNQVMRFNELKARIPNISSRMLSLTLKKFELNGITTRKVYAQVPPKVEYRLTDFGKEYAVKMIDLSRWYLENKPSPSTDVN